ALLVFAKILCTVLDSMIDIRYNLKWYWFIGKKDELEVQVTDCSGTGLKIKLT
ncbi:hypothetical protein L9F63_025936, partial [Diploptera punctata]